jgi:hypothetical protein
MNIIMEIFRRRGQYRQSRQLSISLVAYLALCLIGLPVQAKYEGGTGTADDPYLIATAEQMNEIGTHSGDWDKDFKLVADINMDTIPGTEYNIIETFHGTFDGNDCTISNFSLTSTQPENIGLFGTGDGTIKDLTLLRPNVFAQGRNVGSLIGNVNRGIITNCYAKSAVVTGDSYVGGLAGYNSGRMTKCSSSGSVSGNAYIGGLVGHIGDGTLTLSYSRADVSGNRNVGGLVGKTGNEGSEITHCYAMGDVEGETYVGGLAGQVEQGKAYKSYSTGSVSGTQYVGGLTGRIRVLGMVSRCFWDTQTSGQTTDPGATGKTTAQMQMMNTFISAGWDFWNTWTICEGTNYPTFQWQISIADFDCPDGVNFYFDFAFFAARWHRENCSPFNSFCEGTDFDQSGTVDVRDLKIFTENWLEGLD